jgi:hypothetical protein
MLQTAVALPWLAAKAVAAPITEATTSFTKPVTVVHNEYVVPLTKASTFTTSPTVTSLSYNVAVRAQELYVFQLMFAALILFAYPLTAKIVDNPPLA